jgi:hypothetical protein
MKSLIRKQAAPENRRKPAQRRKTCVPQRHLLARRASETDRVGMMVAEAL